MGAPVQNFELSGVEIAGPNADISYREAISNRLLKRNRYVGRGVAIWRGDHIYIHDVKVHHCPGSGIRVNNGDYVTVAYSEVYANTWWSSAAESAIVFAVSQSVDESNEIKMAITRNVVYDNVNKIPYYNTQYKWDESPIGRYDCSSYPACQALQKEDCPWQCRYGKVSQDYVIDGSGVYVTRNSDTYLYGSMELSYNTCFRNGINGVVFHRTNRGMVKQNVIYNNGVVPRLDIPETNPQDWHEGCAGKSRQPYSGLVLNGARDVELWNNTVAARYDDDFAVIRTGNTAPLVDGGNNQVCQGRVDYALRDAVSSGLPMDVCIPDTLAPSPSPSLSPSVACFRSPYEEVRCGDHCHLIQWPHEVRGTFAAPEAKDVCTNFCESNDCQAFSLQFDPARNNGDRKCILYKESQGPQQTECASDPFNTLGCYYGTMDGQFFVSHSAKVAFNVMDAAI